MTRWIRTCLLGLEGFVALTALGGGATLVVATLVESNSRIVLPDISYLAGSPFSSYLVPGILLAVVIGGSHGVALTLVARRSANSLLATVVAAMALNIWVFVELVLIPFSYLQVIYFVAALGETGLAMLGLGLLRFRMSAPSELRKPPPGRSR